MEKLAKELPFLNLPSTMWGIHIHPQFEYIGILHIDFSNSKLMIDKGILLAEEKYGFKAKIFLNGLVAHVPNIILDITNLSELSALVYLLHDKNICKRFVAREESPDCLKLVDIDLKDNILYCNICKEKGNVRVSTTNIAEPYTEDDGANISYPHNEECEEHIVNEEQIPEVLIQNEQGRPSCDQSKNIDKGNGSDKLSREKQALCNFCGKIFSNGYRIEEHILTHTQEKPFQCKICHKSFSKGFNLKMHEHTHSGDRPYVCSLCGKSYTTSSNLRTHTLSSHSNEKKHVCDICSMTFVYPRYLKLHMRKHTGERPFVCSACGKKFSKNIHLTIHMRTHTGEKPHRCDICGKGFTTTGGLGYHKRVHHKNSNS